MNIYSSQSISPVVFKVADKFLFSASIRSSLVCALESAKEHILLHYLFKHCRKTCGPVDQTELYHGEQLHNNKRKPRDFTYILYVSIVGTPLDLSEYVDRLTIVYYHKGDKSGQKRVMRER